MNNDFPGVLNQLVTLMHSQMMRSPDQLAQDFQLFLSLMNRPVEPNPSGAAMEDLAREFDQFVSIRENEQGPAPPPVPPPAPAPVIGPMSIINAHAHQIRNLMSMRRHRTHGDQVRQRLRESLRISRMLNAQMDLRTMTQAMRLARPTPRQPVINPNMIHENNIRMNIVMAYNQRPSSSGVAVRGEDEHTIAFVWDLEDMTMLAKRRLEKIAETNLDIDAMALSRLVDQILTASGFGDPDEVASRFVANIEDAFNSEYSHARKYLDLKNLYTQVSMDTTDSRISNALLETLGIIAEQEDLRYIALKVQQIQHHRWKSVKKSLNLVNRKSNESPIHKYANVVLSKKGIPQAVAELMVAGQASSIPIENIYSRFNMSKTLVWRRIQRRFGTNCTLIYVTSNFRSSPKDITIRLAKVNDEGSIDYIYNAQRVALE